MLQLAYLKVCNWRLISLSEPPQNRAAPRFKDPAKWCECRTSQERSLLVSLGQDDTASHFKVWSIDSWAKTAKSPTLLRAIDVFAGKHAEAQVTQLAIYEGSWPQLTYAVGLASGFVLIVKADTGKCWSHNTQFSSTPSLRCLGAQPVPSAGKDRIARMELSARPDSSDLWQVTGLAFTGAAWGAWGACTTDCVLSANPPLCSCGERLAPAGGDTLADAGLRHCHLQKGKLKWGFGLPLSCRVSALALSGLA